MMLAWWVRRVHTHTHTYKHTNPVVTIYLVELAPCLCYVVMLLMWLLAYVCHHLLSHVVVGFTPKEKVQTASDVCCSLKQGNDLMTGGGGGGSRRDPAEDVMDRIKPKHGAKLALLNNGFSLLWSTSVHRVLQLQEPDCLDFMSESIKISGNIKKIIINFVF